MSEDIVVDRRFVGDMAKIGIDCVGGFLLALFIFQGGLGYNAGTLSLLARAVGGVFPDFLQFIYFKFGTNHLSPCRRYITGSTPRTGRAHRHRLAGGVIIIAVMISKLIR